MSTPIGHDSGQRGALRETVLLAGAAAASFLLSLARNKLQALAFGPIGMGAIGLMQSSMSTGTIITGLGVDSVVTRELARTPASAEEERRHLRDAAVRGMPLVASIGALGTVGVFYLLSARLGFGSTTEIVIVAIGALFGVVGANLRAVLAGLRQVRDLGIGSIVAAAVAAAFVAVLFGAPSTPVVWALAAITVPLAQLLVFAVALGRHPAGGTPKLFGASVGGALALSRKSTVLAVAGVLPVLSQLLVRTVAHDALNDVTFGYFQAALALAAISISVLASSVGPSVLPRLSAASSDPERLSTVVSDQVAVYLLLYAPLVLALEAVPELVIRVVYSEAFLPVADQLRWQLVGEVLRLPCWVMGTALTARGLYRQYLLFEGVSLLVAVAAVAVASSANSLAYLGVGLSVAVLVQFMILVAMLWSGGVRLTSSALIRVIGAAGACALAAELASISATGRVLVLLVAVGLGVFAVMKLRAARGGFTRST